MAIQTHPSDNFLPTNFTWALNRLNVGRRTASDGLTDAIVADLTTTGTGTVAKLRTAIDALSFHPSDAFQESDAISYLDRCKIQASGASAAILTDAEVETAATAGLFSTLRNAVADDSNEGTAMRTVVRDVCV